MIFPSKIFSHRKILTTFLIISIFFGILMPHVAEASAASGAAIGCGIGVAVATVATILSAGSLALPSIGVAAAACGTGAGLGAIAGLSSAGTDLLNAILYGFLSVMVWFSKGIASFATGLLNEVLISDIMKTSISSQQAFVDGWTQVRSLANMLIVLGFVVVGIAFTLRIEGYGTKKVLINLILVALLVNFSGLFCGLIIDGANILTDHFLKGGGGLGIKLAKNFDDVYNSFPAEIDIEKKIIDSATFIAAYLMIAFVFFYLIFILLAQKALFAIFYILSPLAFACWVFPATKKMWNMWWENFIKWAFLGAQIAFFVWIASKIATAKTCTEITLPGGAQACVFTMSNLQAIIILVFLYVAIRIAKSSSATGAGAVMGLAGSAAGFAIGAITGGAGLAARATGLKGLASRLGTGAKDAVTGASEKYLGKYSPVKQGTTAINKDARLKDSRERLGKITDDETGNQQLAKIAEQRPVTAQQQRDKAAAAELLAKRKKWNMVDPRKRDAVAAHAAAMGVSKDTFTKTASETFTGSTDKEAYDLARHKEAKMLQDKTGMSTADAWKSTEKYVPKPNEIRDAKADLEKKKITQNALGLLPVTDKDATNKLIENEQKTLTDTGYTRAEALEMTKKYVPKEHEIASMKQTLADEKIQKAVSKLDGGKIPELPKEILSSKEFGENVGYQALERSLPRMSGEKADELQKLIPHLNNSLANGLNLKSGANKNQITQAINALKKTDAEKAKKMQDLANKLILLKNQ